MKRFQLPKKLLTSLLFLSLFLFLIFNSSLGNAQDWSRGRKSEFYLLGQHLNGDTTTGLGIKMELKDTNAGGLGFGTNINDYLNLNLDLFFGSTDFTGRAYGLSVTSNANLWAMNLNLDYNILKTRFTPLLTGGIGFISFSGSMGKYNYYFGNYYYLSTINFSEVDFSYNLGGGFRWDITDHIFMKAVYRAIWTKLKDSDKSIMSGGPALSIGFIF